MLPFNRLALIGLIAIGNSFIPNVSARVAADTAFVFFNAKDTSAVPKKISQTGLFRDILAKTVNPGITRFEINTALWSDGAAKIRYFVLPKDSQITYRDDSAYSFPRGTVFIKNFLIDTIQGNAASRIFLETRFLVKQNPDDSVTNWYGFSYRWARDQSDADLINPAQGLETTIPTYTAAMQPYQKKWSFPSQSACWRCHMSGGRQVLGFYTAELNRSSFADPTKNQLETFVAAGVFRGNAFPDFSKSHHWAALSDTSQSLEARARSYLAVNCSFCHSADGRRVIGTVLSAIQDFDYFRPNVPVNYVNQVAKFDYGIPNSLLIYGGNPDKSIILYRMKNRAADKMPPLATAEPDTLALRVVSEWVNTLPTPPGATLRPHGGATQASNARVLAIRGDMLYLEMPVTVTGEVRLFDNRGQAVDIHKVGPSQYLLPSGIPSGLYVVKFPASGDKAGAGKSVLVPYYR